MNVEWAKLMTNWYLVGEMRAEMTVSLVSRPSPPPVFELALCKNRERKAGFSYPVNKLFI